MSGIEKAMHAPNKRNATITLDFKTVSKSALIPVIGVIG